MQRQLRYTVHAVSGKIFQARCPPTCNAVGPTMLDGNFGQSQICSNVSQHYYSRYNASQPDSRLLDDFYNGATCWTALNRSLYGSKAMIPFNQLIYVFRLASRLQVCMHRTVVSDFQ